jgi:hypothetical protein
MAWRQRHASAAWRQHEIMAAKMRGIGGSGISGGAGMAWIKQHQTQNGAGGSGDESGEDGDIINGGSNGGSIKINDRQAKAGVASSAAYHQRSSAAASA